jgi:hypothetical protein
MDGCSVLILAGGLEPTPLQRLMGFPPAGLPLGRERTLLSAWLEVIDRSLGPRRTSTHLLCGTAADEQWFLAELRRSTMSVTGVAVRRDERPHRGVCGTLADAVEACGSSGWLLVVELNTLPPRSLSPIFEAVATKPAMVVGASDDERPAGAFLLRAELLEEVPRRGYHDLKEQFLPLLVARGHRVAAARLSSTSVRLTDRRNYLRGIRIWQSENCEDGGSSNVAGHALICSGVELASSAFILDSVVLPGAVIGPRCVVARSVVGPLIHVPEGSVLVDAVMANPSLGDRPADFRVSSGIPAREMPKDALPSWSR